MPLGSATLDRLPHPKNAPPPIEERATPDTVTESRVEQPLNASKARSSTVELILIAPVQHALDGVVLSTQPVMTTPHEYFLAEYTLSAKLAGA
jgi:hypothetical protein